MSRGHWRVRRHDAASVSGVMEGIVGGIVVESPFEVGGGHGTEGRGGARGRSEGGGGGEGLGADGPSGVGEGEAVGGGVVVWIDCGKAVGAVCKRR